MSAPFPRIVADLLGRIVSLGRPLTSTGVEIGRRAANQIDELLGKPPPRFAAFISYSHRDMAVARWLHRAIETYPVPRALVGTQGEFGAVPARLRPVFRDEDELAGAAELGPKLRDALARSNALVVICSPTAAASVWVDREIVTFKSLNPGRPVFAVIASGTPGGDERCFPTALLFDLDANGAIDRTRPLEPLAPDLGKLDRRTVKLKLAAGLLGVGYTRLHDREQHRRRRFAAAVGSFATVLLFVLSALSIAAVTYAGMAVRARNAALRAQRTAVLERNAAVTARALAERRLWLAQRSAQEVRFQMDLVAAKTAPCARAR